MTKLAVFLALICVSIAVIHSADKPPMVSNKWTDVLCRNRTKALTFLQLTRKLIATAESNSTYAIVLQTHAHTVAYIKSNMTARALQMNCTAYFVGYQNAQNADQQMAQQEQKVQVAFSRMFIQMVETLEAPIKPTSIHF